MSVNLVALRLSAMDSLHVKSVAENELNLLVPTQVCKPVPGEHAFYSDDQTLAVWSYYPEKAFGITIDFTTNQYRTLGIENTDVLFPSVKIDSTIMFVRFGVKSHVGSLWKLVLAKPNIHPLAVYAQGGPYTVSLPFQ